MFSCSADSRPDREGVYALVVLPTVQKAFLDKGAQEDGEVTYTITIPDVPPSLNKVLRMHWARKKKLAETWAEEIYFAMPREGMSAQLISIQRDRRKMRVKVTLHNARQFDKDNAYGACKVIFDAMKRCGLIVDDRAEFLEASVEQVKSTRKQKHTVIEIGAA